MSKSNVRLAMSTVRRSKTRSFFTTLGILIAVSSVVTIVGLGQGAKQQITKQIDQLGSDLITVRPGNQVHRDSFGRITGIDIGNVLGGSRLSDSDYNHIAQIRHIGTVVPFASVPGSVSNSGKTSTGSVVGTSQTIAGVLKLRMRSGSFFSDSQTNLNVAIIGSKVAGQLFDGTLPLGRAITIRDKTFLVQGVIDDVPATPFFPNSDYNNQVFIPYNTAKQMTGASIGLNQILIKPNDPRQVSQLVKSLNITLTQTHDGANDFTVLDQADSMAVADNITGLLTRVTIGAALVALLVGGAGIMNIMVASVTERTREIGIRKAVGATNRQILNQFMAEAAVISLVGGISGIVVSVGVNLALRIFTNIQVAFVWQAVVVSLAVAMFTGVFFGIVPAVRAARKDPIEALRHE